MVWLTFTKFGRFVWSKSDLKYVATLTFTLDGPRENLKKRDRYLWEQLKVRCRQKRREPPGKKYSLNLDSVSPSNGSQWFQMDAQAISHKDRPSKCQE